MRVKNEVSVYSRIYLRAAFKMLSYFHFEVMQKKEEAIKRLMLQQYYKETENFGTQKCHSFGDQQARSQKRTKNNINNPDT